jgi:hypothetical protein
MNKAAPVFEQRKAVREVGVYYSSSSQLLEMMPGGFRNHADQPHSFSFYGWGTALTFLHMPWQAVPEWKMDALSHLRVLVIPSSDVFPSEDVPALRRWVEAGGSLIIAGSCGTRLGESGNFDRVASGSTLQSLLSHPASAASRKVGMGRVLFLASDPGYAFYQATTERPKLLPAFAGYLQEVLKGNTPLMLDASKVDWKTEMNLHRDENRLFVDICNTNIDLRSDTITPTAPIVFSVALPPDWNPDKVKIGVLSPDETPRIGMRVPDGHRIEVTVPPVLLYTSVIIAKG